MKVDVSKFIYLPILKGKLGEYSGAREVSEELKTYIAPIFVLPPASDLDHEKGRPLVPAEHIRLFGARLIKSWGKRPAFIDATKLDDDWHKEGLEDHPLTALVQRARTVGAMPLPVTALDRSPEYQAAMKRAFSLDRYGIGLRLQMRDLESESLTRDIELLLRTIGCQPSDVAVVLDFAARDFGDPAAFASVLLNRINHLPHLNNWRLVAFSGTEFPRKIAVSPGQAKSFRRGEWKVIRELFKQRGELIRPPIFSDYGIEHPHFSTGGGRGANVHIRYSTQDECKIQKGGKFKEVGYAGIIEVARAISNADFFRGADFSAGDQMISAWANNRLSPGTASTWRQAGVCHHLTLVVKELAEILGIEIPTSSPVHELQNDLFAESH